MTIVNFFQCLKYYSNFRIGYVFQLFLSEFEVYLKYLNRNRKITDENWSGYLIFPFHMLPLVLNNNYSKSDWKRE